MTYSSDSCVYTECPIILLSCYETWQLLRMHRLFLPDALILHEGFSSYSIKNQNAWRPEEVSEGIVTRKQAFNFSLLFDLRNLTDPGESTSPVEAKKALLKFVVRSDRCIWCINGHKLFASESQGLPYLNADRASSFIPCNTSQLACYRASAWRALSSSILEISFLNKFLACHNIFSKKVSSIVEIPLYYRNGFLPSRRQHYLSSGL